MRLAGDPQPPLRRLHSDSIYETDRRAKQSFEYWRQQPTDGIVDSLKPGAEESLKVYPDGTIANGNTSVKILQERGFDIDRLPRDVRPREPVAPNGPRGGGVVRRVAVA